MSDIAAVLINWNSGPMLQSAVESLISASDTEIVVVDNASSDGSLRDVRALDQRIRVIENSDNIGLASAINQAFGITETPFVLILNPDVRARPGAVDTLRGVFDRMPRAAVVGGFVNPRYLPRPFPTIGRLVWENLGFPPRRTKPRNGDLMRVEQPAASALMIRREAFDEVGGFDEQFYPAWYEDVDFCRAISRAGWEAYFHPGAVFDHDGGYSLESLGFEQFMAAYHENQFRYALKHLGRRSVPVLKAALIVGLLLRMIPRPQRARSYWRILQGIASK